MDLDPQEELVESFKVFDRDGNGMIGQDELKQTMKSIGLRVGNKEIEAMLAKYDVDNDGYINYSEFVKIMM